jgi:hypothetical protein
VFNDESLKTHWNGGMYETIKREPLPPGRNVLVHSWRDDGGVNTITYILEISEM